MLVTDNETTYGTYQKKHEENFLKVAESRIRKTIPEESDLPKDLIMDGDSLGGNGVKINLY